MSREMRRVPEGWEHPRMANGEYQPLFDTPYPELDEDDEEADAPDPAYYRPDWTAVELSAVQWYETVSEGTPVSPVFPTIEDLGQWLTDQHGGDYAHWLAHLVRGGWCPSGIGVPGVGFFTGEQAIARGLI